MAGRADRRLDERRNPARQRDVVIIEKDDEFSASLRQSDVSRTGNTATIAAQNANIPSETNARQTERSAVVDHDTFDLPVRLGAHGCQRLADVVRACACGDDGGDEWIQGLPTRIPNVCPSPEYRTGFPKRSMGRSSQAEARAEASAAGMRFSVAILLAQAEGRLLHRRRNARFVCTVSSSVARVKSQPSCTDHYILGDGVRRRNGKAILTQAFNVKLNCLVHVLFGFVLCSARCDASR
jgi:hypothetical protein